MEVGSICTRNNFGASFSTFGKIQYMIRLHRFPKAANAAMQDLRNCECDFVQISGLKTVRLLADKSVYRKPRKGVISPKFIKEQISSMLWEAIENAADAGQVKEQGKVLLKQFPHRTEEITKYLNNDHIVGLNELARECRSINPRLQG